MYKEGSSIMKKLVNSLGNVSKRALCIILMLLMLVSGFPLGVLAAEGENTHLSSDIIYDGEFPTLDQWIEDTFEVAPSIMQTSAANDPVGTGFGSNGKFLAPIEPPDPDAIKIYTAQDLWDVRDNLSGSYVLMNDIDLSTINGGQWVPLGNSLNIGLNAGTFTGVFDGQGFVIHNLRTSGVTTSGGYIYTYSVGLFSRVLNATIKNVGLEGTLIDWNSDDAYFNVGAICGSLDSSSVSNCYNTGDISVSLRSRVRAGGICGYVTGSSISYSYNTGDISVASFSLVDSSVGGICGEFGIDAILSNSFNSITNSHNTGNITISLNP